MTLNEMILYVADAMNLSSVEAKARVGRSLNVRYKRVTSAIGLITSRREEATAVATIGDREIVFEEIERVDTVFRKVGTKNIILDELTNDEMVDLNPRDEPPTAYSIFNVAPRSVTIMLDCVPTTGFTLYAHGLADASTLSNTTSPAFPESFHDVLIHGAMADEYRKAEKPQQARECEVYFEQRLSDLKMFIAKSTYLELYPGKHRKSAGWWDTGPRN
jgi:hypothetical protein